MIRKETGEASLTPTIIKYNVNVGTELALSESKKVSPRNNLMRDTGRASSTPTNKGRK